MNVYCVWALFFLSVFLHMLVKAAYAAKSSYTPWKSLVAYVGTFWPALLGRFVIGIAVFAFTLESAAIRDKLLAIDLNPAGVGFPLAFGWLVDSIVDKFTGLLPLAAPKKIEPPTVPGEGIEGGGTLYP